MLDATLLSAAVIGFGIIMYVVLDGFDLGVGILSPIAPSDAARDVMMDSIAPVWDGNETWLVMGGAVLFAAFPMAYAILLPAFYIPIMLLLFGLILRGVAFEFRKKADRSRRIWDASFSGGSVLAAISQGFLLGGLVEGVTVRDEAFAGNALDWLTPFSVLTGAALVAGYGLLGATWLIVKTEGDLQAWARQMARPLMLAVMTFMAIVSIATPLLDPLIAARWFGSNFIYLAPVPMVTGAVGYFLWRALERHQERAPFWLSVTLFLLGYLGLVISLWPNIVPPSLSIWDAASPPSSQAFVLIAVVVTMPLVLGYTAYAYRVFRGKVSSNEGYTGHA